MNGTLPAGVNFGPRFGMAPRLIRPYVSAFDAKLQVPAAAAADNSVSGLTDKTFSPGLFITA